MVALLVAIGLIQIAGYWFSGAIVNGDGPLAIPQPDTALYLQSAERVAAGHPFSFSEGTAVSTGSTTVLHPFLFSLPAVFGVHGLALVSWFFWMNAALYLVFLLGWGAVISKHIADVRAKQVAVVLLGLFPQPAYASMAMSDIGLWLGVSGLFAAALAYDKRWLYGALLVLAPWVRPEGMVLAIAFAVIVFGLLLFSKRDLRPFDCALSVVGIVSVAAVFGLNYSLTGTFQFSSVARKGYFYDEPFSSALSNSFNDLMQMARAFFFGQTSGTPRQYYMIPIVGGIMFWIGAFVHDWRGRGCWRKYVLPVAMLGGLWTVATSGWQNTNMDRYLAWIMPLVVMLMSEGYAFVSGKLVSRTAGVVILSFPLLFAAASSVVFWSIYNSAAHHNDQLMKFGVELDKVLPADASLGLTRHSGIAFPLRTRRIASMTSVYSPEFASHLVPENLETLKNHPEKRFTHWLFAAGDGHSEELRSTQSEVVMIGIDSTVAKADWKIFDRAAAVPTNGVAGLELVFRVDVGDPDDEAVSMYEVNSRYGLRPMRAFSAIADIGGEKGIESGRVILGFDEMFVPLSPNRDTTVVMRTLRKAHSCIRGWLEPDFGMSFDFGESQRLELSVKGVRASVCEYNVASDVFEDVVLHIPGSAISDTVSRIAFLGDHIACCYWFFQ